MSFFKLLCFLILFGSLCNAEELKDMTTIDTISELRSLGSPCYNTIDCAKTLFCIYGTCRCLGEDNWKNGSCIPKKTINSECQNSFECRGKLLCYDGKCQCGGNTFFWNETHCVERKGYSQPCTSSSECQDNYRCKDHICDCKETDYSDGNKCSTRKSQNERCTRTEECMHTLTCLRQLCQCPATDYWTGGACALRKSENVACVTQLECKETLQCKNNSCQCQERDYWNGSYCVTRRVDGGSCQANHECQTALLCTDNICQCPVLEYYDGIRCLPQKILNRRCKKTNECKGAMKCIGGRCQCDPYKYLEGDSCVLRKGVESSCEFSRQCKENLQCTDSRCVCNDQYYWGGLKCIPPLPSECEDIDSDKTGVYTIYPPGSSRRMSVYCIMDGYKKWTVIQRRIDGTVDFYRTWSEYKNGFGSVNGEHWLGNDNIHLISSNGRHELSIRIEDWYGEHAYANYSSFRVSDESNTFYLSKSGYTGKAGDSLSDCYFRTYDRDSNNCAKTRHGAWWYCSCGYSNLNGEYNGTQDYGQIHWYGWRNYKNLKSSLMMIRKR